MLKKIMEKHLFRVITIIVLLCVGSVGYVTAEERKAWSAEISEPGMGVPDEEADRILELMESGMSFEEAYNQSYEEFYGDEYRASQSESKTSNNEVSEAQTHASSNATTDTQKTEPKAETQPQTKPAKVYAHDFDAITDEAKGNFIHFSEDGTPDSMYLNIRAESAMNTITGRELNATTSGNEVGSINYVDAEGNVLRSWVFENWKSDDDFYLDLSAYLEPYASEELVAAYKLSLQDVTLPEGNTVVLKVQSPYADGTVVNIFTEETGELKETDKTLIVADGCITFEFTDAISTPVMSPETLIEKSAESVDEASTETSAEKVADTNETETEVAEQPTTEVETKTDSNNYAVLVLIGLLAIVAAIIGFVFYNKKHK